MSFSVNLLKGASETGEFLCDASISTEAGSASCRRPCEVTLFKRQNPIALVTRVVVVGSHSSFESMYISVVDEEFFRNFPKKKRFVGSFSDYITQLVALLESCSIENAKREMRITDAVGRLHLEVVENGTFKTLALVSLPCSLLSEKDALEVLKMELTSAQNAVDRQQHEGSKLDAELLTRQRRYGEEMSKLREAEAELKEVAESKQARKDEDKRRKLKAVGSKLQEEQERLSAELERETAIVDRLEAHETSLSRKTEVIALEKSELEETVRFLKQQKEAGEEAKRLGKEEEEVLKEEIKTYSRQIDVNEKMMRDLNLQAMEWEKKMAEMDAQMGLIGAEEARVTALMKKRSETVQKLGADLLAANLENASIEKDCSRILLNINKLENITMTKEQCFGANQTLIGEANRRLVKVDRERRLAIEASNAKAKEEKLADLERELKINREVISYMDRKLEQAEATSETEESDKLALEKLYCFPGLSIN